LEKKNGKGEESRKAPNKSKSANDGEDNEIEIKKALKIMN